MGKSTISQARSYREMGEFWETHDLTKFWDQTEPADFMVALPGARMRGSMQMSRAYNEVIDFIAANTNPSSLIAFRPSEAAKKRVADLIEREKSGSLSPVEAAELEHYMELEHIMRLAKARARQHLDNE